MEQKHSGLGIASFIISIASGLLLFGVIVIAGVLEASAPEGINEESPAAIVLGLCIFGFLFVALVALGLGIGALFQRDRKKVFALLGTVFSACALLGTISLILVGIALG